MTHRSRLKLASLMFAVLWTLWMIWSLWPLHPAPFGLLAVSGALAGLAWHWLYGDLVSLVFRAPPLSAQARDLIRARSCARAHGERRCAAWQLPSIIVNEILDDDNHCAFPRRSAVTAGSTPA